MDTIEIVASLTSLLAMGYAVGVWHERQRRSRHSLTLALRRVSDALAAIHFHAYEVSPNPAPLGCQLALTYTIENELRSPLEVWLGADIEHGSPVAWFYDITQDKVVTLERGRRVYSRYLTIGSPLSPGRYRLNGGLWFGPKSLPERSVRLAQRSLEIEVLSH